ncbi:hypothetical protein ACFL3F_00110 [Planctomycetota bacterium]
MPGNSKKAPVRINKASLEKFLDEHKVMEFTTPYLTTGKQKKRQAYYGVFSTE